jgi:hypothetical protein
MGAILDGMVVETGAVFAAKFMLPWSFSEQAAAATKPPGLFGIDLPRPHITEVRVVDPSTSGTAPAEFGSSNLEAFADRLAKPPYRSERLAGIATRTVSPSSPRTRASCAAGGPPTRTTSGLPSIQRSATRSATNLREHRAKGPT